MNYYEVAPTKIVRSNSNTFTYSSSTPLLIGSLVIVSVGKSQIVGVVMSRVPRPSYATKDILNVIDMPNLPQELVELALWMAEYYHTHLATVLQTILPRGVTKKRRAARQSLPGVSRDRTNYLLNKDQLSAFNDISAATSGTVILHGITGSGKTAVYAQYAKDLLSKGKSVIILVPEISLTSQLVAEFRQFFPDILLTHSRQTEAERHLCWLDALNSTQPRVVIGPRSALFMPLAHIGAIIIDEAHEPSFKQDQSPRYSALRVAGVLAQRHKGTVVQGSATPLVGEYYLARHNNRPIIKLKKLAQLNAKEPTITMVDMTKKGSFTGHRFMSDILLSTIKETLVSGKQALVFHNRRGSASTTLCEECGWSAMCARCFVPLTLHSDSHQLRCHICDMHERVPTSCPTCHSTHIIHKGIGTKLIESELSKIFPNNKIVRFDGDSHNAETVESLYQSLYDGSIDIIIGTQVIAKGLDLPHLRTVGVIQADAGLALPDFAASERTFQLLAQVVGRVGRSSHDTQVIVQSYQPNAPAVRLGIAQDYDRFYEETLAIRKKSSFPPFSYLLKLTCSYKTEAAAIRNSKSLSEQLKKEFSDVEVLGPTPSFYERQRDSYRWQVIVKSKKRSQLLKIIDTLPAGSWQYDIDPASLL